MHLAAEAGMHMNALGFLERGQRSPSLHTVFLLAEALEVKVATLLSEVETELRRKK